MHNWILWIHFAQPTSLHFQWASIDVFIVGDQKMTIWVHLLHLQPPSTSLNENATFCREMDAHDRKSCWRAQISIIAHDCDGAHHNREGIQFLELQGYLASWSGHMTHD